MQKIVHALFLTLLSVLAGFSLWHAWLVAGQIAKSPFTDMHIFALATNRFIGNGTLYVLSPPLEYTYRSLSAVFKFPPLYALDYYIWQKVGDPYVRQSLFTFHFWLHLLRYAAAAALMVFYFWPRTLSWYLLAIIVCLLFAPFYESLYGLAFDNLVLFVLVILALLARRKDTVIGPALVAYLALAKIYPAILALHYLFRRNWLAVRNFIICVSGLLLLSVIMMGVRAHAIFFVRILPVLLSEHSVADPRNLSLMRLFGDLEPAHMTYSVLLLAMTAVSCYQASRHTHCSAETTLDNQLLALCMVTCLMVLLIPNCWGNYQEVLLFPILYLLGTALDNAARPLLRIAIALLAWSPMLFSTNYVLFHLPLDSLVDTASLTPYVHWRAWSPLVLWIGTGVLLIQGSRPLRNLPA